MHSIWTRLVKFNPFPKRQIFRRSKQKEFADDNFKFNESGRKFSKRVENTVGKGEIARHEQFLLFPQCFQKCCIADTYKLGLILERVNLFLLHRFEKQVLTISTNLYQIFCKRCSVKKEKNRGFVHIYLSCID